jgi:hypothetical protein
MYTITYRRTKPSDADGGMTAWTPGTHFNCFTGTKVQILTAEELRGRQRMSTKTSAVRSCRRHR